MARSSSNGWRVGGGKGLDAKVPKGAKFRHGASGPAGDKADLEGGGGGEGLEGAVGGDLGVWGAGEEDEAGLGGEGLGEGDGVEGVDIHGGVCGACSVGGGGGGEGLEFGLLDGTVGVEKDAGDGVVGAGASVEERAGGRGYEGGGVLEDLFEEGGDFAVVGRDDAVGEAGGVELDAGMGGEEGGEDPESG